MFRVSCFLILAWTALAGDFAISASLAEDSAPRAPIAPPTAQAKKVPDNPFRCDRLIKYRGKTLACDSALRRDGESLRVIFAHTPDALGELDQYQTGRNNLRYSAYVGTAGLLLVLTSNLVTNLFVADTKATARQDTSRILRYAGGGIALGSIFYGLSSLHSNEAHLQNAIIKYNASEPDKPIEILFKTEF